MFPELNSLCGFDKDFTPDGQFVLITESAVDASFVMHHFLSVSLRADHNVCLVGLAQSFNHYNSVGNKLGISLSKARESGQLVFVEGLKMCGKEILGGIKTGAPESTEIKLIEFHPKNHDGLQPLYETIRESVGKLSELRMQKPTLVVVDDLSILLALGVDVLDLVYFAQYLRQLVCDDAESGGYLVASLQDEAVDDECNALLQQLQHHSDVWIQVTGLKSGYCTEVHGQVTVRLRDCYQRAPQKDVRESLQFKIMDKAVSFFAAGTSSVVL